LNTLANTFDRYIETKGTDFIFILTHDFGSCTISATRQKDWINKKLSNSIILSTYGELDTHCFSIIKDIVIPTSAIRFDANENLTISRNTHGTRVKVDPAQLHLKSENEIVDILKAVKKDIFVFFSGNIWWGNQKGDGFYSRGIREKIFQLYENKTGYALYKRVSSVSTAIHGMEYNSKMKRSEFCLCMLGFSLWTPRTDEAIANDCIPVIIADGIVMPFERYLNWGRFSVKIMQKDINKLDEILKSISEERKFEMRMNLWRISALFKYEENSNKTSEDLFELLIFQLWMLKNSMGNLLQGNEPWGY